MTTTVTTNGFSTSDEPRDLTAEEFALMTGGPTASITAPAPTMAPPQGGVDTAGAISGQKVTALWANAADRNAWLHLQTAGWKQLSRLSDNGTTNLAQLAASARQTGAAPYVEDDAAGVVTALYVW